MDKDLNIEYVFAMGKCMVKEGKVVVKGTFEQHEILKRRPSGLLFNIN